MSDLSGLVSIPDTLNLDEFRIEVLAGFGAARKETILLRTSAYTLNGDADLVIADLTSGAFEVTLPASPVEGDRYEFLKLDASGNALTIGRNGKNINGAASNVTISSQLGRKVVTWSSAANSWISR
jgi:hypothetical protein